MSAAAEIEPRHDTSRCPCGGPLVPEAYRNGMLRPQLDHVGDRDARGFAASLENVYCAACGVRSRASQVVALQAWWSAGAHEQRMVDEDKHRQELAKGVEICPACSRVWATIAPLVAAEGALEATGMLRRDRDLAIAALKSIGFTLVTPTPYDVDKARDIAETALVQLEAIPPRQESHVLERDKAQSDEGPVLELRRMEAKVRALVTWPTDGHSIDQILEILARSLELSTVIHAQARNSVDDAMAALEAKTYALCRAEQSEERDDALGNLISLYAQLSEVVQHLAPEHDEAGAHFEECAQICQRAIYATTCPVCERVWAVRPEGDTIPDHSDTVGVVCGASGRPISDMGYGYRGE